MKRRVVVTGMGVNSALGNTPDRLFENLKNGKSAVRIMTEWDSGTMLAAPSEPAQEEIRALPRTARRSMGRLSLFAALAADAAVQNAALTPDMLSSGSCGCVIGSTTGSPGSIAEAFRITLLGKGIEEMPAMQFFKCASHTAAFNTANLLDIRGAVYAPSAACASGLQAIGWARDLIANGTQDLVICGGCDEITPEVCGSFELLFAAASNDFPPDQASRPFDEKRSGLVCGEGAGILVLEEYEHARQRNAHIYGEITGYATCSCGSGTVSQSDAAAIRRSLELVCRDAALAPETVSYINAHATATLQGDSEEADALRSFFPDAPPVSSLKGHLGHTLGASGAIELIATLKMMEHSLLVPTLNLTHPASNCAGLNLITKPVEKKIDIILKNCFAFGGINASLICSKIQ